VNGWWSDDGGGNVGDFGCKIGCVNNERSDNACLANGIEIDVGKVDFDLGFGF
jgi:hypothetical protein